MGGNRKHGFMRGNANGRNGSSKKPPWHCAGCNKNHQGSTFRTLLDGSDYCERTYYKAKNMKGKKS